MRRRAVALAALLMLAGPAGAGAQTAAPQHHASAPPHQSPPRPGATGKRAPSYGGYYPTVNIDSATMHQLLATPAPAHTPKPKPTPTPQFQPQVFGTHSTADGR
jgi:hypothetical protein